MARAHASLKLEEERNRGLPQMTAAQDEDPEPPRHCREDMLLIR